MRSCASWPPGAGVGPCGTWETPTPLPALWRQTEPDPDTLATLTERLGLRRADLEAAIRATGDGKAPGKATEPHRPGKAGRRPAPYTLTVREDGRVSLALRRPVVELKPKDAAALADRLDPILKALRRRAREA